VRILGIDPGLSGALAVLDTKRKKVAVIDMPLRTYKGADGKSRGSKKQRRRFVDGQMIADWIEEQRPEFAVIESVHSFGNEGRASLAKFLTAFGVALGSVQTMLGKNHYLVTPPVWKRRLGLVGKSKEASHALACKLYPRYSGLFAGPRGGLLTDRAEALLIAHYHSLALA
jgi:Holliday junction resolvasome RuvABC endonuclease subunit